jgi:hypothetical protein
VTDAVVDYIERPEFDHRFKELNIRVDRGFDSMGAAIDRLSRKIEMREEQSRPKPGFVIALISGIGLPMLLAAFALVKNMTQLESLRAWSEEHEKFAQSKTNEVTEGIGSLRERQERNVTRLDEQETQRRWMADVDNVEHDWQDRLSRAYCVRCRAKGEPADEIWIDARRYMPMQHIGQYVEGR